MKKINTNTNTHLATKHLFDVIVDTQRLYCESIEQDENGNFILHKSRTISMSSAMGEESEYFLLTTEEYERYKKMSLKRV